MALLTYNDILSRLREKLKVTKQDPFITDRQLWSYYKPWLSQVLKEVDSKNKLMGMVAVFDTLDIVPLVEVDRIEAGCSGLQTGFTVMRTEDPVGELFMESYWGTMIRSISSIDGSELMQPITAEGYNNLSKMQDFKFNKTLYYWYLNDYIYFPNINWRAVKITALCEEDISKYKCNSPEECKVKQEQSFNIPEYMLARIESLVMQSLGTTLQIVTDPLNDNKSNEK